MRCKTAAAALAVFAYAALPAQAGGARVVDGDTLEVDGRTYRLHGIDAPEVGQRCARAGGGEWPCGKRAISAIEDLVLGVDVICDDRGTDAYGRIIGVCLAEGIDVNDRMVRSGFAWSFKRYSHDYDAAEDEARGDGRGVFQTDTQTPWDYRSSRWDAAAGEAVDARCPIKGNISNRGERIYHAPWSPWYSKTTVDELKGERWFCDEAEAAAAGWRAPYWGR